MPRYIDADTIPWEGFPNDFGEYHEDYVEKRVVDKMPTIEARPVVRGEWKAIEDKLWNLDFQVVVGFECSVCGVWGNDDDNFCPNCGAWMRKGEDDA